MDNPELTITINIVLWGVFSALLLEMGLNLYQKSKDINKINLKFTDISGITIVIGFIIIIIAIFYMILFLIQYIPAITFFPHQWLSEDGLKLDLSNVFNVLLLYLMLNVIYRVGSRLMGRSLKLISHNKIKVDKEIEEK